MRRRIEAAVVLVVNEERTLVLRRRPNDRSFAHAWCLPGGRVELGEAPAQTALREVLEETGLEIDLVRSLGPRDIDLASRPIDLRIHRFVAHTDDDAVVLSDEHVDARWLTRREAAIADALLPSGLAGEVTEELLRRFSRNREQPRARISMRPRAP